LAEEEGLEGGNDTRKLVAEAGRRGTLRDPNIGLFSLKFYKKRVLLASCWLTGLGTKVTTSEKQN